MIKDEALKLALKALEVATTPLARDRQEVLQAITAIKEALAQPAPVQEPVAWMYVNVDGECEQIEYGPIPFWDDSITLLYTTPPAAQRPWVGLTGAEKALITSVSLDVHDAVHRTNAKLKEKNT